MARRAAVLFVHARIFILAVLGLGTLAALFFAQPVAGRAVIALTIGALIGGAVAAVQLRHLALAAITAFAPVPGLVWSAAIGGGGPWDYAFAFAFAAAMAGMLAEGRLRGLERDAALGRMFACWPAATAALLVLCAWLWQGWILAEPVLLTSLSAGLLLPAAASFLSFGEDFVTRANRVREIRQRAFERFSLIATPRWGLSISGIALVFAVLGYFVHPAPGGRDWSGCGFVLVASFAVTRQWRTSLAIALAAALLGFFVDDMMAALTLFGFLALFLAPAKQTPEATAHAIEGRGATAGFAALGAGFVMAPVHGFLPGLDVLYDTVAVLVFVPALIVALATLLPRRRSVEELYGRN